MGSLRAIRVYDVLLEMRTAKRTRWGLWYCVGNEVDAVDFNDMSVTFLQEDG